MSEHFYLQMISFPFCRCPFPTYPPSPPYLTYLVKKPILGNKRRRIIRHRINPLERYNDDEFKMGPSKE